MSYATNALKLCVIVSSLGCVATHASNDVEADGTTGRSALDAGATITFGADWTQKASGPIVAGELVTLSYDVARLTACRGEQGGLPQWGMTAFWKIDDDPVSNVVVIGGSATLTPPHAGDLQIWFQNTNRWGCVAYDSAYGANYHFHVQPAADAPGWVGNAASIVSRGTCGGAPCDSDRRPLDGTVFDDWARQRAETANAYFDVWKEGVTDWDDPDLWKQLDVEAHARFVGQPTFTTSYVSFDHRVAHDARYAQPLRAYDPFYGGFISDPSTQCPKVPFTNDGTNVTATLEIYFTVNGTDLRPSPGAGFRVTYSDQAGLYAKCVSP